MFFVCIPDLANRSGDIVWIGLNADAGETGLPTLRLHVSDFDVVDAIEVK